MIDHNPLSGKKEKSVLCFGQNSGQGKVGEWKGANARMLAREEISSHRNQENGQVWSNYACAGLRPRKNNIRPAQSKTRQLIAAPIKIVASQSKTVGR